MCVRAGKRKRGWSLTINRAPAPSALTPGHTPLRSPPPPGQVYDKETEYLEKTSRWGTYVRGFEGYLNNKCVVSTGQESVEVWQ